MYLVLGSAPDVLLPPKGYRFEHVYAANGALKMANELALGPVSLFTTAYIAREDNETHRDIKEAWQHQDAVRAFVDETDGPGRSMVPVFQACGMKIPQVLRISYEERGRLVNLVLGKDLGRGSDHMRVSTGVFAICAAFAHGAEHVMIAGIGFNNGHHGSLRQDQRKHMLGDVEALRILAKRGKCSTTNPILAEHFGLRLVVDKLNLQRVAYLQSDATSAESEACLQAALFLLPGRKRMVDFGSGAGHLVDMANRQGLMAVGLDLYAPRPGARGMFFKHDLGQPWPGGWGTDLTPEDGADLVLCWETAEHVAPEGADALCDNIVRSMAPGGILLFSAAVPGQGGSGHLNEQPHDYWLTKFHVRGLRYAPHITAKLRSDFSAAAPRAWWYGKNLLVFERNKGGRP